MVSNLSNLSYEEAKSLVHTAYDATKDISEITKQTGIDRHVVLELLGFSDEWSFIFDD